VKQRTRRRGGGHGAKRCGGLITDIGPVIPAHEDLAFLKSLGPLDAVRAKQSHTRKTVVGGKRRRMRGGKCKRKGCPCGPGCKCGLNCRCGRKSKRGGRRGQRGGEGAAPARLSMRAIRDSATQVWDAATGSEVGEHIRNLPKFIGKQLDFMPAWMPKSLRS